MADEKNLTAEQSPEAEGPREITIENKPVPPVPAKFTFAEGLYIGLFVFFILSAIFIMGIELFMRIAFGIFSALAFCFFLSERKKRLTANKEAKEQYEANMKVYEDLLRKAEAEK